MNKIEKENSFENDLIAISNIKDFNTRIFEAAKLYASMGFYLVPLRPNGKILPARTSNVNYSTASKNLKTIDSWFNPTSGRFVGYNIGIACGLKDGVFVVDVDRHGEIDGFEAWNDLIDQYGESPTLMQTTPNSGMHLVYKWFDGGISSTNKIGAGIDTRGGRSDVASSHIVVYPSLINGKEYKWANYNEIAPCPEWIRGYFNISFASDKSSDLSSNGGGRGNENMDEGDSYRPYSDDEIRDMLGYIDPNDLSYEHWVKIGMALHRDRPISGLDIWDEWSAKGDRYEPGECAKRWDGFSIEDYSGSGVTIGTLVHMAKSFGWSRKPTPKVMSAIEKAIDEINSECFVHAAANGFKVCMESDLGIRYMTRSDIINHYANKPVIIDGKPKNPALLWLASEDRRELNGFKFDPSKSKEQSEIEDKLYNTFRGFPVEAINHNHKGLKLYLNFVKDIVANGNEAIYNWVLDWLADIFQHPASPKGTALVLVGEEGIGKGVFVTMLQPLLGRHYIKDNAGMKISGRFNDFLEEAILLFADEMTSQVGRKAQQTIKAIITGDELLLEGKGVDARSAFLVSRIIIASNDYEVIRGEKTSRRFLSLEVSNAKRNDHKFFDKLTALSKDREFLETLMHFLMNRPIGSGSHLRKAPETELLKQQKISNISYDNDVLIWVIQAIENHSFELPDVDSLDGDIDVWATHLKRTDVKKAYEDWCINLRKTPVTSLKLYKTLRQLGFKDCNKRMGDKNVAVFKIPDIENMKNNIASFMGVDWESIETSK